MLYQQIISGGGPLPSPESWTTQLFLKSMYTIATFRDYVAWLVIYHVFTCCYWQGMPTNYPSLLWMRRREICLWPYDLNSVCIALSCPLRPLPRRCCCFPSARLRRPHWQQRSRDYHAEGWNQQIGSSATGPGYGKSSSAKQMRPNFKYSVLTDRIIRKTSKSHSNSGSGLGHHEM